MSAIRFRVEHLLYVLAALACCTADLLILDGVQTGMLAVTPALKATTWVSLICLVITLCLWIRRVGGIGFFLFYLLSFYFFTMGQGVLMSLGLEYSFTNVYDFVTPEVMLDAHVFTLFSFVLLAEGGFLAAGYGDINSQSTKSSEDEVALKSAMYRVGLVTFYLSLPAMLLWMVSLLTAFAAGGYTYAFESVSNSSGLFRICAKVYPLFTPSLVMLYLSSDGRRRQAAKLGLFLVSFLYFSIGERTGGASIALVALFMEIIVEGKSRVRLALLIAFLLVFIPILGVLRGSMDMSVGAVTSAVAADGLFSHVTETIATLGYSVFPLGMTMEIVPGQKDFAYGESYFFALLSIFPNILGGTHISVTHAGLAQWLMDYLNMTYGPGFSYPAEAWYNFGWSGFWVHGVIGFLFARCMSLTHGQKHTILQIFIAAAFFMLTITSPRRDFMTVVRMCSYYVFIPYFFIIYVQRRTYLNILKNKIR